MFRWQTRIRDLAGGQDVFLTKLAADGASVAFRTYLGEAEG
jgi:hypothetical protein